MAEKPPIEPQDYRGGVKVVDIGDLRIARGKTRRPYKSCRHISLVYDNNERRIWCQDCESEIEPFSAFLSLTEYFDQATKNLSKRQLEIEEAEKFTIRARATKALDRIWRTRDMVPICPSCKGGLLAEDFVSGVSSVNKKLAKKLRDRERGK